MRSHLKVYFDFDERTEMLTEQEKGRLLLAMLRYAISGATPDLKGNERFLFPVFKGDIDRDIAAYNAHVQCGAQGGRPARKPTAENENQTQPNETKENLTKPKLTRQKTEERRQMTEDHQEKERAREAARFSPPTAEEVAAYCRERGNRVDARQFCDFYTAKGWKVGNQAMKDWRACVRTWENRDGPQSPGKRVGAQQYAQREYTEEELLGIGPDLLAEARARREAVPCL